MLIYLVALAQSLVYLAAVPVCGAFCVSSRGGLRTGSGTSVFRGRDALRRARRAMGVSRREVALVGDQIFTDALGANLYGIPVLLVQPMRQDTKATIRLKRALEKPVLARYYKKGGRVHGKEEDRKPPDA